MEPARLRRGQAEVIGGLLVLTVIFLMVIPLILVYMQETRELTNYATAKKARIIDVVNEKLTIAGVPGDDPRFPALWINNTGTVTAWLDSIYLYDTATGKLVAIIDFKMVRPGYTNSLITGVTLYNYNTTLPPLGKPVPLPPLASMLIQFNGTNPLISGKEENILVRVETLPGVVHPKESSGSSFLEPKIPIAAGPPGPGGGDDDDGIGEFVDLWNMSDAVTLELLFKVEFQPLYTPSSPVVLQAYYTTSGISGLSSVVDHYSAPFKTYRLTAAEFSSINVYMTTGSVQCIKSIPPDTVFVDLLSVIKVNMEGVKYMFSDAVYLDADGEEIGRLSELSSNCPLSGPGFIPHQDITDPVSVDDFDGDGYAEIRFTTVGANHYSGMKDGGFAIIAYVTTDDITMDDTFSIGFIIEFDVDLKGDDAWHAAGKINQPFIGVLLIEYEDDDEWEPVAFKMLTYRDIGSMLDPPNPTNWKKAEGVSIVDVFHGLDDDENYKIAIILVDAHPFTEVEVTIQRISIYGVQHS